MLFSMTFLSLSKKTSDSTSDPRTDREPTATFGPVSVHWPWTACIHRHATQPELVRTMYSIFYLQRGSHAPGRNSEVTDAGAASYQIWPVRYVYG